MKHGRWLLLLLPLAAIPFFFPLRTIMAQVAPQFGDPLPGLGPVYNAKICSFIGLAWCPSIVVENC